MIDRGRRVLAAPAVIWLAGMALAQSPQTGISGRILDAETGLPVADAKATLVRTLDPARPTRFSGFLPLTVEADATGQFAFAPAREAGVEPTFLVFAWAPNYGFSARRLDGQKGRVPQDFLLPRTSVVSGRVVNAEGAPVVLAEVGVVYEDPRLEGSSAYFPWQYASRMTDAEGRFQVEASPDFAFCIEAGHQDYLPAITELMKIESDGARDAPRRVELELAAGVRLQGRVVDADGRAAAGVNVRLVSRSRRLPRRYSKAFAMALDQSVTTGPDGVFVFKAARPGDYELIATRGLEAGRLRLQASESMSELALSISPR